MPGRLLFAYSVLLFIISNHAWTATGEVGRDRSSPLGTHYLPFYTYSPSVYPSLTSAAAMNPSSFPDHHGVGLDAVVIHPTTNVFVHTGVGWGNGKWGGGVSTLSVFGFGAVLGTGGVAAGLGRRLNDSIAIGASFLAGPEGKFTSFGTTLGRYGGCNVMAQIWYNWATLGPSPEVGVGCSKPKSYAFQIGARGPDLVTSNSSNPKIRHLATAMANVGFSITPAPFVFSLSYTYAHTEQFVAGGILNWHTVTLTGDWWFSRSFAFQAWLQRISPLADAYPAGGELGPLITIVARAAVGVGILVAF